MLVRYNGVDDYWGSLWRERCRRFNMSPNAVYEAIPFKEDSFKILHRPGLKVFTVSRETFDKSFKIVNHNIQKNLGDYL